jgi:ABC-type uncharacterized transport system substrate-binding protein
MKLGCAATQRHIFGGASSFINFRRDGVANLFAVACLCTLLAACSVAKVVVEHEPASPPAPQPKPSAEKPPAEPVPSRVPEPVAKPEQQVPVQTAPATVAEPEPEPEPAPEPMPVQLLPTVAILVSADIPAYMDVANELNRRLAERTTIYQLNRNVADSSKAIDEIQRSDHEQVVAIGLVAARAARGLVGKQVIFCQVFNYADYDLVTGWMKGVSMLPRFSESFRVWKDLDPTLRRVAMLTGANQEHIVAEAREAAQDYGIELVHGEVYSDKETLYAFKRLAPEVQGLWLLPDNRVLSTGVIRATLSYSVRHSKQVLVFSPSLLKIGGLISIRGRESDVAAQVLARLQQAYGQSEIPGADVMPLAGMQLEVNARMAKRLGLIIPTKYRQLTYEP